MQEKRSFYWIRTITEDKVVYTSRTGNRILSVFLIVPLAIIPVVGWAVCIWLLYYSVRGTAFEREIRKLTREGQVSVSGARFSTSNPVRVTVDRQTFDRIIGQGAR